MIEQLAARTMRRPAGVATGGPKPEARACVKNVKSKSFPSPGAMSMFSFSIFLISVAVVVVVAASPQPPPNSTHQNAINYLLYSSQQANQSDTKLTDLLADVNHNHAGETVNLQFANSVWSKMHQNALEFASQRAQEARPSINRLLEEARVSVACKSSLNQVLDGIARLDSWALQMYNAFGNFPAIGLFEGTRTSMGSYHQCVNVPGNQWIGRAQYCTFKFQPVVPKRPRYHNILASIEGLANFTREDDMFHDLAKKAQYFYYTKLRLATCMPSKCQRGDVEQLGRQMALNSYIQFAGVSCLEKEEGFNLDGAQVFALTILIGLASISLLGTLVHLFNLRSILVQRKPARSSSSASSNANSTSTKSTDLNKVIKNQTAILLESQQQGLLSVAGGKGENDFLSMRQHNSISVAGSSSLTAKKSLKLAERLLVLVDFLMHFSIVLNGKKLFDTSTSRGQSGRCDSSTKEGNSNELTNLKDSASSSSSGEEESSAVGGPKQSSDISCVHGLRFWTISWIILGHTMQYTEWAGFARTHEIEQNITSFWLHPVLNATFSVDTFFLISGLLTTYVTWTITRGQYARFNKFAFLISRYLRLTPQVFLVILLFIVFPLLGDGPYWRGLIQKESDNCKRNWWVNALYLQAFIKQDQICNLVTWWLSIEMFYHFVSIFVIIALLQSTKRGLQVSLAIGGGMTAFSCYLHFVNRYPPNMLPTLLQRYEIWDSIVLKFFWTPYPHAASYFVGLLLGYILYNRSIGQLSKLQVRLGWLLFAVSYLAILFGTYSWNKNAPYSRITSSAYYNCSQVLWSLATGWAIWACAMGHGGWLNSFLSSSVFIPLGRATYMTYLSHMIIVMSYPAKMNMLIEPSYVVFLYIFISNLFLSYLLGIVLTLVYESPILYLQKMLVANMAQKVSGPAAGTRSQKQRLNQASHRQDMVAVSLMDKGSKPVEHSEKRPADSF